MAKINEELLQKFDSFQIFMQTAKYTSTPIIVKGKRPQHESSLEYVKALECSESFGNSYISIEVKNGDADHFSAKLMTDEISSKILLRYDSAGTSHRNNFDDIPLSEQLVTTPHIHKYDEKGRLIATKTDAIQANPAASNITEGFPIFCSEGNIYGELTTISPKIQIGEQPVIPFEHIEVDPCEGVPF